MWFEIIIEVLFIYTAVLCFINLIKIISIIVGNEMEIPKFYIFQPNAGYSIYTSWTFQAWWWFHYWGFLQIL